MTDPRRWTDVTFALVIAAVGVWLYHLTAETYFRGDEWGLLHQGMTPRGMVEPYNDHLSVTILAVYRVLIEAGGFAYGPFRAAGIVSLLAVPVALYVTTRHRLGPPLAAAAALSLLTFVGRLEFDPAVMNHYFVLLGAVVCAWVLDRRGFDWLLGLALAFALSAAAGGLAVAAACVVHSLCTRAPWRRWVGVLVPCVLWGVWWLAMAHEQESRSQATPSSVGDGLRFALDVAVSPFDHVGFALGGVLAVAFLGYGPWLLRGGLIQAANWLAWAAALGIWVVGLAYTRGDGTGIIFPRYQIVALTFVLLALVPHEPIRWPVVHAGWSLGAAVAIALAAVVVHTSIRDEVEHRVEGAEYLSAGVRTQLDTLRAPVPGDPAMNDYLFFDLRAGEVRAILERYT